MAVTNGTNITAIEKPEVGVDTGPGWATSINNSLDGIDGHDHTTNKGSRITPAALNINADLEMNSNDLTEIRTLSMDSTSDTTTADQRAIYVSGSNNLHYRNGSGQDVQITDGTSVVGAAGTITGMGSDAGNQAGASYTDGSKAFNFFTDSANTDFGKMNHSDLNLYKFSDDNTADTDFVTLQCSSAVSGAGGTLTVPGETGTLLTTATSFAGAINIDATGGSGSITLDANTSISIEADTTITLDAESDINLDSNSGVLTFKDNGTAIGKISNSSSDLVIENEVDAKDIIFKQYDGNEVVRMADDRRLYFFDKGGEYIVGDGTDLTVASGGDIILDADGADIVFKDNATEIGKIRKTDAGNFALQPASGLALDLRNNGSNAGIVMNNDASMTIKAGNVTALSFDTSGNSSIDTRTLDVSSGSLTTSTAQKQAIVQAGPGSGTFDVSSGTFTTSTAQKQTIVQAGPGSGTFDVSSGTFTTSSAQKQTIVQAGPGSGTFDVSSGTLTTSEGQKRAILNGGLSGMNYLGGALRWTSWNPSASATYTSPSVATSNITTTFITMTGTGTITITFDIAGRYEVLCQINVRAGAGYTYADAKIDFGGTGTRYFADTFFTSGNDDDLNFSTMGGGLVLASASQTTTVNPRFRVSSSGAMSTYTCDASMTIKYLGGV